MKYTVWIKPGRVPVEVEAASAFDAKCAVVHCLQDVTTCDVEAMPAVEHMATCNLCNAVVLLDTPTMCGNGTPVCERCKLGELRMIPSRTKQTEDRHVDHYGAFDVAATRGNTESEDKR